MKSIFPTLWSVILYPKLGGIRSMFLKATDLYTGDKLNVISLGENAIEVTCLCKYSTETQTPHTYFDGTEE